MHFNRKKYY